MHSGSSPKLKMFRYLNEKLTQIEVESFLKVIWLDFVDYNSFEKLIGLQEEKKQLQEKINLVEQEIQEERRFTRVPGSPKQKVD